MSGSQGAIEAKIERGLNRALSTVMKTRELPVYDPVPSVRNFQGILSSNGGSGFSSGRAPIKISVLPISRVLLDVHLSRCNHQSHGNLYSSFCSEISRLHLWYLVVFNTNRPANPISLPYLFERYEPPLLRRCKQHRREFDLKLDIVTLVLDSTAWVTLYLLVILLVAWCPFSLLSVLSYQEGPRGIASELFVRNIFRCYRGIEEHYKLCFTVRYIIHWLGFCF